jgi:hypothetical protein
MIEDHIINFIRNKSLEDFPNETCGFIVKENHNFLCIPATNIAKEKEINFQISTFEYLKIKNKYNKIHYIYHSHTNDLEDFSNIDENTSNFLLIPFILYFLKKNQIKIYEPKKGIKL